MPTSLLVLRLFGGGTAHAACPTASPDLTVCGAGCDHTTIAAALTAAATGDVVCVSAGTYTAKLALTTNKQVRIEGDGVVTVNGGAGNELVQVTSSGDLELVGIDLGSANNRRCLDVSGAGSTVLLEDTVVSGCTWDSAGAAKVSASAALTVRRSSFVNNHNNSHFGGAIWASAGATIVVEDSSFINNYADDGGAIQLDDSTATLTGVTFDGNDATSGDGGALRAIGTSALTVEWSTFTGDVATDSGGGMAFQATGALVVTDTVFDACDADTNGGLGGGLFSSTASVQVLRSSFVNCSADYGGGLNVTGAAAGSRIANSLFQDQYCQSDGGGAAVDGTLQVRNNAFVDNDCSGGGSDGDGILFQGGNIDFRNNVLAYQAAEGALRTLGSVVSDYNSWYSNGVNATSVTLGSNELIGTNPSFAGFTNDGTANDNLFPAVGSPLVNRGDPALLDINGSRSDIGLGGGPDAPDQDADGVFAPLDCDDEDPDVYPGAQEVAADGVDQDCDGSDACYRDNDGDGFGGAALVDGSFFCVGANELDVSDDCNDNANTINPNAAEVAADGIDQDCDGADACYRDVDDDNYGGDLLVDETDGSCTDDANQSGNTLDCDDTTATRSPGNNETPVNGVDNDCDNQEDCYRDQDRDGHGTANLIASADLSCSSGTASTVSDDCDDGNDQRFPGNTETPADGVDGDCDTQELCWRDTDRDTYGTTTTVASVNTVCTDAGESTNQLDCVDTNPSIKPGGTETVGDGVDQDCDTHDACWDDADNDGHGGATRVTSQGATCSAAQDEYTTNTDCADNDPNTHQGATEVVNDGVDEDCDGQEACHRDLDQDTYGSASSTVQSADPDCLDAFEANDALDCDDTAAAVNPSVAEVTGDAVDQNCDGLWSCWTDGDRDGYGSTTPTSTNVGACGTVAGFSITSTDCDDTRNTLHPGGTEIPDDGLDQDCSGTDTVGCVPDTDRDGYGTDLAGAPTVNAADGSCDQTQGESDTDDDCNDRNDAIHPTAQEIRNNGIDEDCDGQDLRDCYVDSDDDNFGESVTQQSPFPGDCVTAAFLADRVGDCDGTDASVYPGAPEVCGDGVDANCSSVGLPLDEDGDGVPYDTEIALGSDDCLVDSDADGLRDGPEVLAGTDPASTDTDGDTVADGVEWGPPLGPPADTDSDTVIDPLDEDDDDDLVDSLVEETLGDDDWDDDTVPNRIDTDDDGDGLLTALEDLDGDGDPRFDDTDIDGAANWLDVDDDGDGIDTELELAVLADPLDTDSDGDTIPDAVEWPYGQGVPPDRDLCVTGTVVTACPDGLPDIVDPDDDGDNIPTRTEGSGDFDGDLVPNYLDADTDGDTRSDLSEGLGDADDDGAPNYKDPIDDDGPTGDPDLDGLSTNEERELCLAAPQDQVCSDPNDPDTNDDLVPDGTEAPAADSVDTNHDGEPDWMDDDDDGDGYPTAEETGFVCDDGTLPTLTFDLSDLYLVCADGSTPESWVPGSQPGEVGEFRDTDADETPDYLDDDDDGDGVATVDEDPEGDSDGDGLVDPFDPEPDDGPLGDLDHDGLTNEDEEVLGTFPWSEDSDNDGVSDGLEAEHADTDSDGTADALDQDDDGDGLPTSEEGQADTDGDGTPDYLDEDSDGDGLGDEAEQDDDVDCDGLPDVLDATDDARCGADGPAGALRYTRQACEGCASGPGSAPPWLVWGLFAVVAGRRRVRVNRIVPGSEPGNGKCA